MDILTLKKFIFENNFTEKILKEIGMHTIRNNVKYISSAFPDGDNPNGCLVYLTEYLNVVSYTRDIPSKFKNLDIIDLVGFVLNISNPNLVMKKIMSICGVIDDNVSSYKKEKNGSEFFKNIKKTTDEEIKKYSLSVLNEYYTQPHIDMVKEGLYEQTLHKFKICFDLHSERIIFPHFNKENENEILALVGRTTKKFYKELNIPKYLTIKGVGYKKTHNLYGLAQNHLEIKNKNEVIIFEGEKSVLKAYQYGYKNCVSVGCHDISNKQISILLSLKIRDVVICFDKDIDYKELEKINNKLSPYFQVYFIYDKYNFLNEKDTPIDKGKKLFDIYYKFKNKYDNLKKEMEEYEDVKYYEFIRYKEKRI